MNMRSDELVKDICDVLGERLSNGVTVSHEYPNYVRVVGLGEGVSVHVGLSDDGHSIEWQTNGGACNDLNDVIDASLTVGEIVNVLCGQWVTYGVDER
jgi:hypothetical protein